MKGHEMTTTENSVYTARQLCEMILPPTRWVAKDLMAEGFTMLSARPKAGKSLLALQLGIAVATGTPFLGRYETVKGPVLYINVDDPSRKRLQTNLLLLGGGHVDGLTFMSNLPELDNGGLDILDQELARIAKTNTRMLLILDTLTALRREQVGRNLIKSDYEFMASIARLGRSHKCEILAISHSPKGSPDKVDAVDLHMGTTGITAAVDTLMVLTGIESTKKVLQAKGRDISPFEVHLELQAVDRSGWVAVDAPEPEKKELGALRQRILDAVRAIGPCGPDAVSKYTGVIPSTIRVYMRRMTAAGQLAQDANACYSAVEHTPSVTGVTPVTPVAANYEDPATVTPDTPHTQPVTPDPAGEVSEKYHTETPETGKTPDTPPTRPVLFKTRKGKIWEIGQDVACLTYELKITKGGAEALLTYGQNAGQILTIVQNSWKEYSKADSRVAYLRDILEGGKKANNPAESTSKPLPMPSPAVEDRVEAMLSSDTTPTPAVTPDTQPSIIDRLRAVIDFTPRGFNDIAELAGVTTRESSDALLELLRGEICREEIDGLAYFSTVSPVIPQNDGMEASQWLN